MQNLSLHRTALKIELHESLGPLLRGIGVTLVLVGTVLAAIQAKESEANKSHAHVVEFDSITNELGLTNRLRLDLTREAEGLRDTVQHEEILEDIVENPWFDILGMTGSAITATSFFVEWIAKRQK